MDHGSKGYTNILSGQIITSIDHSAFEKTYRRKRNPKQQQLSSVAKLLTELKTPIRQRHSEAFSNKITSIMT